MRRGEPPLLDFLIIWHLQCLVLIFSRWVLCISGTERFWITLRRWWTAGRNVELEENGFLQSLVGQGLCLKDMWGQARTARFQLLSIHHSCKIYKSELSDEVRCVAASGDRRFLGTIYEWTSGGGLFPESQQLYQCWGKKHSYWEMVTPFWLFLKDLDTVFPCFHSPPFKSETLKRKCYKQRCRKDYLEEGWFFCLIFKNWFIY